MDKSIFGWDLPPGCHVSDIPGNRPEDGAWEKIELAFWENNKNCTKGLWAKFEKAKLDNELMEVVAKAIDYGMELGRKEQLAYQKEADFYESQYREEQVTACIENFSHELLALLKQIDEGEVETP